MTLHVTKRYSGTLGSFQRGRFGALLLVRTNGKIIRLTNRVRRSLP